MFKLCLIVCNRYGLADRVGRYLISLTTKYSNLGKLKINEFKNKVFAASQAQRAFVAYTAVHNAF